MCQLFFNTSDTKAGFNSTQKFVNTTCKCAMDGIDTNGFCGAILGADEY